MVRYCVAVIVFILALGAMPGDHEKKWLTCDVCGTLLHTNKAKIEQGSTYYNEPEHNLISIGGVTTESYSVSTNVSASTDAATITLDALNDDVKLAHSGEEYSGVVAGHSNATPGICKPCYDKYAWTIFKKQNDQWNDYWSGVKGKMASERKKNLAVLTDSSDTQSRHRIETQIDSLKQKLRELGAR